MLQSPTFNQCSSSGGAALSRALDSECRRQGTEVLPMTQLVQKLVMRLRALWKHGLSSQIFLPDSQRLIPGPTESVAEFPFCRTEA